MKHFEIIELNINTNINYVIGLHNFNKAAQTTLYMYNMKCFFYFYMRIKLTLNYSNFCF